MLYKRKGKAFIFAMPINLSQDRYLSSTGTLFIFRKTAIYPSQDCYLSFAKLLSILRKTAIYPPQYLIFVAPSGFTA